MGIYVFLDPAVLSATYKNSIIDNSMTSVFSFHCSSHNDF